MNQVDELTVPQVNALLEQIRKYPPTNVILTEFLKGLGEEKHMRERIFDERIDQIPNVTVKKNDFSPPGRKFLPVNIKTRTGRPILKAVDKRTGERII